MFSFIILGKNEHAARLKIQYGEKKLSFKEVFNLWKTDRLFVDFYSEELLKIIGKAFFWEHPPLLQNNLDRDYELVIRKTRSYDNKTINDLAFQEHFNTDEKVAVFYNLGKNAKLIVPVVEESDKEIYKHIGIFMDQGDSSQIRALFCEIGNQMFYELETGKQIWLNTAGLGVLWLHIRLDTRPKYYKTKHYKNRQFFD
ncbi:hypothetical protein [Flammeovirga sp. EKP202]|uniref:DUF6940 family protein n=1 Tax=Flammeovirga sp. EKP202 TaxID=2770592 RepID=UPI00165EDF80|nr:hypothetical protein [Flammeovirga sp. EKP202]MBD0403283.1 hypothetical protein [Flammeovirga sp. EKP202]